MKNVHMKSVFPGFITAVLLSLCLFSCRTVRTESWTPVSSLDQLAGKWETADGSGFEYPVEIDGKKYIQIYGIRTDDTDLWRKYAELHHIRTSELWEKRYACAPAVYNSRYGFPTADSQDIQYGIKFGLESGNVYGREEYLVPERILAVNLSFFCMSDDMQMITEGTVFHLMSDIFPDIIGKPYIVYEKN
jgi:hypothetical protein